MKLYEVYHKICAGEGSAEVSQERAGTAVERAPAKDYGGDGALGLRVGDADETTRPGFVHCHFGDERDSHASADHGEKAGEVSAFEHDMGIEAGTVAGGYSGITKAVAITEEKERVAPEIRELQRGAAGKLVRFG
jgi:hypothetical protein